MNPQVRQVQWALMKSEKREVRLLMLQRLHNDWIATLQAERQWPLESLLEMLLLTDGDSDEIDRQLAKWTARPDQWHRGSGIDRSYQQFLSVLHAQHQLRLETKATIEQAREDVRTKVQELAAALERLEKL